jgi:hypothetical protein
MEALRDTLFEKCPTKSICRESLKEKTHLPEGIKKLFTSTSHLDSKVALTGLNTISCYEPKTLRTLVQEGLLHCPTKFFVQSPIRKDPLAHHPLFEPAIRLVLQGCTDSHSHTTI